MTPESTPDKILATADTVLQRHGISKEGLEAVVHVIPGLGTLHQQPIHGDVVLASRLTDEVLRTMVEQGLDGLAFSFSFLPGPAQVHRSQVLAVAAAVLQRAGLSCDGLAPVCHAAEDGELYQQPLRVDAQRATELTEEVVRELVARGLAAGAFSFRFMAV